MSRAGLGELPARPEGEKPWVEETVGRASGGYYLRERQ